MRLRTVFCLAVAGIVALPAVGRSDSEPSIADEPAAVETSVAGAAARLQAQLEEPALADLVAEALHRNPGIAAAQARARSAAERVAHVRSLPDPVLNLGVFVLTPETRTGSQLVSLGLMQGLPWFGKLALKEQAALLAATALEADVEAERLGLVTEIRRLVHEIRFLDRYREITESFGSHLSQHEEIARARYSTGVGQGQGVVKLQAAITRLDRQLLDIASRRVSLVSRLNSLRDREASAVFVMGEVRGVEEVTGGLEELTSEALEARPEMAASRARIAAAETLVALAEKGRRPDFTVGLTYTLVDPRDDPAGRLQPPAGNGDDILGIQGGVTLPVRRQRITAGIDEARESLTAAREGQRLVATTIRGAVADLVQQLPLSWQQIHLSRDVLTIQAEEALESAQAGYVAGTLNALDLLDAEHVLFEAHTAVARSTADYLIALAKLEGAVGMPLRDVTHREGPTS